MSKERINFSKGCKLHLLCDVTEDGFIHPSNAYVMFFDNCVWTCDYHILLRAKISEVSTLSEEAISVLNEKTVYMDTFKKLLTYDIIIPHEENIECRKFKSDKAEYLEYMNLAEEHHECLKRNWRYMMDNVANNHFENISMNEIAFSFDGLNKITSAFVGEYTMFHSKFLKMDNGNAMVVYPTFHGNKTEDDKLIESGDYPIMVLLMGMILTDKY